MAWYNYFKRSEHPSKYAHLILSNPLIIFDKRIVSMLLEYSRNEIVQCNYDKSYTNIYSYFWCIRHAFCQSQRIESSFLFVWRWYDKSAFLKMLVVNRFSELIHIHNILWKTLPFNMNDRMFYSTLVVFHAWTDNEEKMLGEARIFNR